MQTPRTPEELARSVTGCYTNCRACIKNDDICESLKAARLAWQAGRKEAFGEMAKEILESNDLTGWTEISAWAEGKACE